MVKKLVCVGMALVMSVSMMSGIAFAAASKNSNGEESANVVMPRSTVYPVQEVLGNNSWRSTDFSATSSNGNYIRIWYQNSASGSAKVYLIRTDSGSDVTVASMTVAGNNGQDQKVYHSITASSGEYYILIEASDGGTLSGNVAVAQYKTDPTT